MVRVHVLEAHDAADAVEFGRGRSEPVGTFRAKGMHMARELKRPHVLAALDRGVTEAQIMEALGMGRNAIRCTRAAFLEDGLEFALYRRTESSGSRLVQKSGSRKGYGILPAGYNVAIISS